MKYSFIFITLFDRYEVLLYSHYSYVADMVFPFVIILFRLSLFYFAGIEYPFIVIIFFFRYGASRLLSSINLVRYGEPLYCHCSFLAVMDYFFLVITLFGSYGVPLHCHYSRLADTDFLFIAINFWAAMAYPFIVIRLFSRSTSLLSQLYLADIEYPFIVIPLFGKYAFSFY